MTVETENALLKAIENLTNEVKIVQSSLTRLELDTKVGLSRLEGEVKSVQVEVQNIKEDVREIKIDLKETKNEVSGLYKWVIGLVITLGIGILTLRIGIATVIFRIFDLLPKA